MNELDAERWSRLFRVEHRPLRPGEVETIREIKAKATELAELIVDADDGRYVALALTALEQTVMWSIKGITE